MGENRAERLIEVRDRIGTGVEPDKRSFILHGVKNVRKFSSFELNRKLFFFIICILAN